MGVSTSRGSGAPWASACLCVSAPSALGAVLASWYGPSSDWLPEALHRRAPEESTSADLSWMVVAGFPDSFQSICRCSHRSTRTLRIASQCSRSQSPGAIRESIRGSLSRASFSALSVESLPPVWALSNSRTPVAETQR